MSNQKLLKSFSRRIGKTLSNLQEDLIANTLPSFLVNVENPTDNINKKINIEVGIGMAEHFVNQCKLNPYDTFLGFEPYLNGIANCLKLSKAENISNFRLWPNDADLVLSKIPNNRISKFYLLFPDPWPKKKQQKRRFASKDRINLFFNLLERKGQFIFASDIEDYVENVLKSSKEIGFIDKSNLERNPHEGYIVTKYNMKATKAGRKAQFLLLEKP